MLGGIRMRHIFSNMIALGTVLALTAHSAFSATVPEPEDFSSPRLASLARELKAGNREALAAFWKEMAGTAPLEETIDGGMRQRRITFVWRGSNDTQHVSLIGGLPGANL